MPTQGYFINNRSSLIEIELGLTIHQTGAHNTKSFCVPIYLTNQSEAVAQWFKQPANELSSLNECLTTPQHEKTDRLLGVRQMVS